MTLYTDLQTIAGRVLSDFDQGGLALAVYTPGGGPAHDPGEPTYPETDFAGTVRGVSAHHLADTLIQASDLIVTMAGSAATPKLTDRVKIGGEYHTIVKIERKPAAGTVVAWRLFVRK